MHFDWETFTYDEAWLREAAHQEAAAGCDITAGYDWGTHLGDFMANPQGYSQFAHLRSMVIQAWKQFVADWELGIGTEAAEAKGQELLLSRLHQPDAEVQETLIALLEAKLSKPQEEWVMTEAIQAEFRNVFNKLLKPGDWSSIAETASHRVYLHVLNH
ncbi:MAG: hypothetical protein AAFZ49_15380 [Cyanobacteria bacterium J06659_2]